MADKKQKVDLDFESQSKAVNLPAPTAAGDAANKAYVDAAAGGASIGLSMTLARGNFAP